VHVRTERRLVLKHRTICTRRTGRLTPPRLPLRTALSRGGADALKADRGWLSSARGSRSLGVSPTILQAPSSLVNLNELHLLFEAIEVGCARAESRVNFQPNLRRFSFPDFQTRLLFLPTSRSSASSTVREAMRAFESFLDNLYKSRVN
jgi:hypothetical protein